MNLFVFYKVYNILYQMLTLFLQSMKIPLVLLVNLNNLYNFLTNNIFAQIFAQIFKDFQLTTIIT